jgi:hypothetical protein
MSDRLSETDIGIGATRELTLRVSIATLVKVLFQNPKDGEIMLALERKATLLEKDGRRIVETKAQPFGGAIQIQDTRLLHNQIGSFHFDSEQSRSEQDFRIFIAPLAWGQLREFCLQHLNHGNDAIFESDPVRELAEEFAEVLGLSLQTEQYTYHTTGTVIEDQPSATDNFYARDGLTVRIYRIFEARILDPSLANRLMINSEGCTNEDLQQRALEDAQNGEKGWANAALTLPLHEIRAFYETILPEARNKPISFQNHKLDETVAAILEDVTVPKYQKILL